MIALRDSVRDASSGEIRPESAGSGSAVSSDFHAGRPQHGPAHPFRERYAGTLGL